MNRKSHVPAPNTGKSKPLVPSIFPGLKGEVRKAPDEIQHFRARALASPGWDHSSNALQEQIDKAHARAFSYRFLARGFDLPVPKQWQWLCNPSVHTMLCSAVKHFAGECKSTGNRSALALQSAHQLVAELHPGQFEPFAADYLAAFGETERASHLAVPLPALTAFMHGFGLTLTPLGASTPADYLCVSFEFASWLATRQAEALEQERVKDVRLFHEARQKILREHCPAWVTVLTSKQIQTLPSGVLRSFVKFALEFLSLEQIRPQSRSSARAKVIPHARVSA